MKSLLLLTGMILSLNIYSQSVPKVLTQMSDNSEPKIVDVTIEDKHGDEIMIMSLNNQLFYRGKNKEEWVSRKLPEGSFLQRQILAGKSGSMLMLSTGEEGLKVYESENGGISWALQGKYQLGPAKYPVAMYADARTGHIHLVYTQEEEKGDNCHSMLMTTSSSNKGKKWEKPIKLNSQNGNCDEAIESPQAPASVSFDDRIITFWLQNDKLQLDRSYNKGITWLRNDIAVPVYSGSYVQGDITNVSPKAAIDNSTSTLRKTIYLYWTEMVDGYTKIKLSRTSNFGDTWTPDVSINKKDTVNQYFPQLRVDQSLGAIYLVYYSQGSEGTNVYLCYSINGGQTFSFEKLNEESFDVSDLSDWKVPCSVAAFEKNIAVTWLEEQQGEIIQKVKVLSQEDLFKLKKGK